VLCYFFEIQISELVIFDRYKFEFYISEETFCRTNKFLTKKVGKYLYFIFFIDVNLYPKDKFGKYLIIIFLIDVNLYPKDKFGKYPLDYARQNSHLQIAQQIADFQGIDFCFFQLSKLFLSKLNFYH
jgi:hypothetical protein